MDENKTSSDAIREIVERLKKNGPVEIVYERGEWGETFHFGDRPTGMIFEEAPADEPSVSAAEQENSAPPVRAPESAQTPAESAESAQTPAKKAEPAQSPAEEFLIPDAAPAEAEPSAPSAGENGRTRIYRTYMPRFTEASENYRMAGDPNRPKAPSDDPPPQADDPAAVCEGDPTADGDESEADADVRMIDTTVSNLEEVESALNVFKFGPVQETPAEEVLSEDERAERELNALLHKESDPVARGEESDAISPAQEAKNPLTATAPAGAEKPESPKRIAFAERAAEYDDPVAEDDAVPPEGAVRGGRAPIRIGRKKHPAEYTSASLRDAFKDRFLDRLLALRIRFFAAAALVLFSLLFTLAPLLGGRIAEAFFMDRASLAAFIDVQLCVCLALLALPECIRAIRFFLYKKVTSELSLLIALLPIGIYGWYSYLSGAPRDAARAPIFAFLYGLSVLAAIGGAYLRTKAEFLSFRVISAGAEKCVVDRKLTRTLEKENLALDGVVDESRSRIARVFRTDFVSDFVKRSGKSTGNPATHFLTLFIAFGSSVTLGAIVWAFRDAAEALASFALTFLVASPVFALLSHKLPFYHAERVSAGRMSTAIGESSLLDYSSIDVLTFVDTEIFEKGDVYFRRVMFYGDRSDLLPKAMKQMASLYLVAGGPLRALFASSMDRKPRAASHVHIETDGVSGEADGHLIDSGTASYMRRHGIPVPEEEDVDRPLADSTKVIYAAEDGTIYAKFLIRYSFSETFTSLLPLLNEERIAVLVYTTDPCIDNDLSSFLTNGQSVIRVLKKTRPAAPEEISYREISSGLVTLGDKTDAISMILLSKTYSALCRKLSTAETVLGSLGAAACVVLSLFDALSPISALALAGCRIVSSLVLYFVSRSRFGPAADFGEADRAEPDPPKSNDEEKEQHVAVIP